MAASAFTDMSLLFFSLAALYFTLRRRWGAAGLMLGLAFWGKQQAIFFFPAASYARRQPAPGRRCAFSWLLVCPLPRCCSGDAARPEPSIFLQAAANNSPAQLIAAPTAWLERLGGVAGGRRLAAGSATFDAVFLRPRPASAEKIATEVGQSKFCNFLRFFKPHPGPSRRAVSTRPKGFGEGRKPPKNMSALAEKSLPSGNVYSPPG